MAFTALPPEPPVAEVEPQKPIVVEVPTDRQIPSELIQALSRKRRHIVNVERDESGMILRMTIEEQD